jgi:hypothetical protein
MEGRSKHKKAWKVVYGNPQKEYKEHKNKEEKFDGKIDEEDLFSEQYKLYPIIEHQQQVIEFLHDHDHKEDAKFIIDRILIVLDDQAGLFKMSPSNNPLINFVLKHRHYSTSLMFVTQAYKAIPKAIRINMNCLVLFEIPNQAERVAIYEEYPDKLEQPEWEALYWMIIDAEPYSFLYMNNHFPAGERIHERFEHKIKVKKRTEAKNGGIIDGALESTQAIPKNKKKKSNP